MDKYIYILAVWYFVPTAVRAQMMEQSYEESVEFDDLHVTRVQIAKQVYVAMTTRRRPPELPR